jgi:hypothetical protein
MESVVYRQIRQAILRRQQVLLTYKGLARSVCPHAIGFKRGVAHTLVYQFAGASSRGAIVPASPNNWRCMIVAELRNVRVREGPWYTAWNFGGASTCIDEVDVSL